LLLLLLPPVAAVVRECSDRKGESEEGRMLWVAGTLRSWD
jgi:hypothetical protein